MVATEGSLRGLREKLLATAGAQPVRVLSLHRSKDGCTRRVCIEIKRPAGPLVLFFFRHGDGSWHVFPPVGTRRGMSFEAVVT